MNDQVNHSPSFSGVALHIYLALAGKTLEKYFPLGNRTLLTVQRVLKFRGFFRKCNFKEEKRGRSSDRSKMPLTFPE